MLTFHSNLKIIPQIYQFSQTYTTPTLWKGGFQSAAIELWIKTSREEVKSSSGGCCTTLDEKMTGLRGALATVERKLHKGL